MAGPEDGAGMRAWPLALVALLGVPGAQACSLAYVPFSDATFHDDGLWYVDGSSLRHVQGGLESTAAEGFFLSYARLEGERLLVAGQDGLGADCSGDRWMELRDGDAVVWREERDGRVFAHPEGPFVQSGRSLLRLDGDDLVRVGDLPEDAWILGFTTEGDPVLRDGGRVTFGTRALDLREAYGEPAVAHHDGRLGVLEVVWSEATEGAESASLHVVDGDRVRTATWGLGEDWGFGLAWADGWYALAGGRAFLVTDDAVTDLGVEDARAVAARGTHGVVFTETGYVVFDGTDAVEAWERSGAAGLWRPTAPDTQPARNVAATWDGDGQVQGTSSPPGDGHPGDEDGVVDVPASAAVALLALALAAATRRRR